MTDKELFKQLNALKEIKMDADSKSSHKSVLMMQISNTISKDSVSTGFNSFAFIVRNIFSMSSKPVMVLSGVFLFVVASLAFGSDFYKHSKPTDSMYIARVLSERVRLNTTFNQEQRAKLATEFANRNAQDIAMLLMDPDFNNEENKEKVQKLNDSFINEINKVKNNMSDSETMLSPATDITTSLEDEDIVLENSEDNTEDELVVTTASSLREDEGIEVSVNEENASSTEEDIKNLEEQIDTLSAELSQETVVDNNKKNLVEEIEKLFNEARYAEVLIKLKELE